MSFLSSIFPLNTATPSTAVAGPAAATAAAPAAATPAIPAPAATPATPATPTSSLDQFTDLWKNPTTQDGKPAALPVNTLAQPIFNFDPAKITETANKMDFTAGIAPDAIQKALSGDASAFADVINSAVRQAVVGVTMSQGQLINQAVVANNARVTDALPTHLKRIQLTETEDANPVFNHPAAQPLVQSLKQMALARNPQASSAEISKQISDYLLGFASAISESSAPAQAARSQAAKNEPDWTSFLGPQ